MLLTNDGELAFKVSHPKHGSVKTYNVKVRGVPEERVVDKLQRGITLEGKRTLPCEISRIRTTGKNSDEGNSWFEVKLREGRTQQIRKMFQAMGHPVAKLKRVAIGPISDPKADARRLARADEARSEDAGAAEGSPTAPRRAPAITKEERRQNADDGLEEAPDYNGRGCPSLPHDRS